MGQIFKSNPLVCAKRSLFPSCIPNFWDFGRSLLSFLMDTASRILLCGSDVSCNIWPPVAPCARYGDCPIMHGPWESDSWTLHALRCPWIPKGDDGKSHSCKESASHVFISVRVSLPFIKFPNFSFTRITGILFRPLFYVVYRRRCCSNTQVCGHSCRS